MKCIICGLPLDEGAAFCEHCGMPVRKCPQCGEVLQADAVYCEVCGARVEAPEKCAEETEIAYKADGQAIPAELESDGDPAPPQSYCPVCGALQERGAAFCGVCGAELAVPYPAETPQIDSVFTQQLAQEPAGLSTNAKMGLLIGGLALLVALVIVLVILLLGKAALGSAPERLPSPNISFASTAQEEDETGRDEDAADEDAADENDADVPALASRAPIEWLEEDWPKEDAMQPMTPLPTQETVYLPNGEADPEEFILEGDRRYYSLFELMDYSQTQLGYIRNGLFALSGKKFKKDQYIDYFNSKDWYYGYDENDKSVTARMNDFQRANLELCIEFERSMGWR